MIKVLRYGKPRKKSCKACRSRLEYEEIDKKSRSFCGHSYSYIECPVCGKDIYIK